MGRKKKEKPLKQSRKQRQPSSSRRAISLPELHPFDPKRDWLLLALLFVGVLVLYAASAPRTVMLEDDGFFISAAWFASSAHPPGYPLYVLLGWLATHVPLGTIAWRMHTLSGVMGALACVCIAWLVLRRTGHRPAACIAGAALAVSEHFWSQAIIADVYTTNAAVLFMALVLVQEAAIRRSARLWIAAAVVYGLGFANHYPLLILGSPVFLGWVVAARKDFWGRIHYLLPIAVLTAAALYGWMVWRSHQPLPVNFTGPIRSWGEFVTYFNRNLYAGIDTSINAGLADKAGYAWYFVSQALLQFGVVGSLLALYGWAVARSRPAWRLMLSGEALALVASSFLLIALLGFNYEFFWTSVFRPYPLVAYTVLALWLGYGIHALAVALRDKPAAAAMQPALYAVCALVIVALGAWNARINFRAHDNFAETQAQMILSLVEENAIFVLRGDAPMATIGYLHHVEGRRPDLRILGHNGLFFNDRIVYTHWDHERRNARWRQFLRDAERPVYFVGTAVSPESGYADLGYAKKVDKSMPGSTVRVVKSDRSKAYFRQLIEVPPSKDEWIANHRNTQAGIYGEYLGSAMLINRPHLNEYIEDILPLAERNYWTLISICKLLLGGETTPRLLQTAEEYLHKAKQIATGGDDQRGKVHRATALYLEGIIEQRKGNAGKARTLFEESLKIDRGAENHARKGLAELAGG